MVSQNIKTMREISSMMPEFSNIMEEFNSETIPITIFLSIICVLGVLGNSCVISIYVKLKKKSPSIYFILNLAISDFLVCTLVLPTNLAMRYIEIPLKYSIICMITVWYSYALVGLSCLFLLIIAIDRYLAVCKSHKLHLNNRRAFVITMCAILTAFTLSLIPAIYPSVFVTIRVNNETYSVFPERCEITRLVSHRTRVYDERLMTHLMLFNIYVIMILSKSILYVVVFTTLRKREANWRMWNSTMNHIVPDLPVSKPSVTIAGGVTNPAACPQIGPASLRQGNSSDLTVTSNKLSTVISRRLFLVTLIYILTWTPFYLIEFNLLSYQGILHKLYFISNMINPLIYPATSKIFRAQFMKMCCSTCTKK